ncbi:hypothetical protein AAF712_010168 [Marasmius tenuissimus]|uniref:Uncharacterized protein n=1 Tax=Marasmius tenuissimus TaxID=585030 RepID=A0ABR2ZP68_9AGAR
MSNSINPPALNSNSQDTPDGTNTTGVASGPVLEPANGPPPPIDIVGGPPAVPPEPQVPNFPPPAYQEAVDPPPAARATMKILKDQEKWLVTHMWPKYWYALEDKQQRQKKGAKRDWCLANVVDPFRAQFPSATQRQVVHDWFTNRARETHANRKPKPSDPDSLTDTPQNTAAAVTAATAAQTDAATSTHSATHTNLTPQADTPTSAPAAASSTASPNWKPRAVNSQTMFSEKLKDDIHTKAKARCPGKGGGDYLAARQAVITEMFNALTNDQKKVYEDEATIANNNWMFKPPPEHISENQQILVAHVVSSLSALIGDDWGHCGDVSFVVHTIKPSQDSGMEVEMITVAANSRKGFEIATENEPQYQEFFLDPLKRWVKREGKQKDSRGSTGSAA